MKTTRTATPRVLEAECIRLVDTAGVVRASLVASRGDAGSVFLTLMDSAGRPRLDLSVTDRIGGMVRLIDADGYRYRQLTLDRGGVVDSETRILAEGQRRLKPRPGRGGAR